ncbi:MAG: DUF559 domain-containing protein [Lewinellaceae bacterium]|mgnify:CR=1 FL=1|nr:DUF559 domain-containing protein [Lewinellaceae bacterium]
MHNKIIPYNPRLKLLARKLRNQSTLSEVLLWKRIKGKSLGYEFHRQVPIDEFIVDFYCHELMLAIELDGNSHDGIAAIEKDQKRQQKLESFGVTFIRIYDIDVKQNLDGVVFQIKSFIDSI